MPDEFEENVKYAKLERWLHSVGKAASGWEDDDAQKLMIDGLRRGRAAPTIFFHPGTQVRVVVHGDDFTFARPQVRGILRSGQRESHYADPDEIPKKTKCDVTRHVR